MANLTVLQRKTKDFVEYWKDKGYEKGQSQPFWLALLRDLFGIEQPEKYISFEDQVHLDHTSFIDGYITSTRVMIEQKSRGKDLRKKIRQADGKCITPFQQAKRYIAELPVDKHPFYVVACNFEEFLVYDMHNPQGDPESILLENLPNELYRLSFLIDTQNTHIKKELQISKQAGYIVGELYDALRLQYCDPNSEETANSLNKLCVRLVFCLYAEDAGVFGRKKIFHDYLSRFDARCIHDALVRLFCVLNQDEPERSPYLDDDLKQFPYVNGGLFKDRNDDLQKQIPQFTEECRTLLLEKACDFDWKDISPTIFGAIFESTLNQETRKHGGMHYTSIENIHKVIDPLFLDDLKEELDKILNWGRINERIEKLVAFRKKIGSLTFLDPACGSGNFLTLTYTELRKLENKALKRYLEDTGNYHTRMMPLFQDKEFLPIIVKPQNFYGIEINDFAVNVAQTALWIAESQMWEETKDIFPFIDNYLPLHELPNIICANALRVDWNDIVPKEKLSYIISNPPFVGKKYQTHTQKEDMRLIFGSKHRGVGNLDYVTAWYKKACQYMLGTNIIASYVSTNSIVQGEHIPFFWKNLYEKYPVDIIFGYPTFIWDNEATIKASVHCVIIGFTVCEISNSKYLITDKKRKANIIHPYLIEMPLVFLENRSAPLQSVPTLVYGSFALDDGNYTVSEEEYLSIISKEPQAECLLKLYIGADEFINNKRRYCVWLKNANPAAIKSSRIISEKIKKVEQWRSESTRPGTQKASSKPKLFAEIRQPDTDYLAIPITSSENREYIPMGYMGKDIIASNHLFVLPNATLYEFGVLTSVVHMAWMRVVAGRRKSDYNYSALIVYNNYPWCNPTLEQRAKIEKTAQTILDCRARYPDCSLAVLYDKQAMPDDLKEAHEENDKAVMKAYGFKSKMTESEIVAELMKMYQKLTEQQSEKPLF